MKISIDTLLRVIFINLYLKRLCNKDTSGFLNVYFRKPEVSLFLKQNNIINALESSIF